MATPQPAIFNEMGRNQWYVHMSRDEGADLGLIKNALTALRADCAAQGVNVTLLFGPTLLADLTGDVPDDFQPYPGYTSPDGSKTAKGTQEEFLLWNHSDEKDLLWETQHTFRNAVAGHMSVARETPTFIYKNSLDLTGFIDGTENPKGRARAPVALIGDEDRAFAGGGHALDFTNKVGGLAEEINHHPEICLTWGRVHVTIYTHKIDGLADADFIWAAKVDRLLTA